MATLEPLRDRYGRLVTYLRVSVTDRCNLRCFYCLPRGSACGDGSDALSFEELLAVIRTGVALGINKVRITGGEPLVRRGIVDFVRAVREVPGIDDLALSTNGTQLATHAAALRAAGLRRVNVSLDSLRPSVFRAISGRNDVARVLAGIDAAHAAGLAPIKLNVVVARGVNDEELPDILEYAAAAGVQPRFIEYMPLGLGERWAASYVSRQEILQRIEAYLDDAPPLQRPGETATYYRMRRGGEVGIISPVSCRFCNLCNRLRLTADGRLRPCLTDEGEVDLRPALLAHPSTGAVAAAFRSATAGRPEHGTYHRYDPCTTDRSATRPMATIGG